MLKTGTSFIGSRGRLRGGCILGKCRADITAAIWQLCLQCWWAKQQGTLSQGQTACVMSTAVGLDWQCKLSCRSLVWQAQAGTASCVELMWSC